MGRGLQVLLNALIILHLGGHWDGHRGTTPTDAEGTGPTVGEGRSWEMRLENQATYPPQTKAPSPCTQRLLHYHPAPFPPHLLKTSQGHTMRVGGARQELMAAMVVPVQDRKSVSPDANPKP